MIDIFTKDKRFPLLCKIAHLCLAVPISNADSERMFSMMNKIVPEFRSELNNDTVSYLLCSKQNCSAIFVLNIAEELLAGR